MNIIISTISDDNNVDKDKKAFSLKKVAHNFLVEHIMDCFKIPDFRIFLLCDENIIDKETEALKSLKTNYSCDIIPVKNNCGIFNIDTKSLPNDDFELIVTDCRQIINMNTIDFVHDARHNDADFSAVCINSDEPDNYAGVYYFKNGIKFIEYLKENLKKHNCSFHKYIISAVEEYTRYSNKNIVYPVYLHQINKTETLEDIENYKQYIYEYDSLFN